MILTLGERVSRSVQKFINSGFTSTSAGRYSLRTSSHLYSGSSESLKLDTDVSSWVSHFRTTWMTLPTEQPGEFLTINKQ